MRRNTKGLMPTKISGLRPHPDFPGFKWEVEPEGASCEARFDFTDKSGGRHIISRKFPVSTGISLEQIAKDGIFAPKEGVEYAVSIWPEGSGDATELTFHLSGGKTVPGKPGETASAPPADTAPAPVAQPKLDLPPLLPPEPEPVAITGLEPIPGKFGFRWNSSPAKARFFSVEVKDANGGRFLPAKLIEGTAAEMDDGLFTEKKPYRFTVAPITEAGDPAGKAIEALFHIASGKIQIGLPPAVEIEPARNKNAETEKPLPTKPAIAKPAEAPKEERANPAPARAAEQESSKAVDIDGSMTKLAASIKDAVRRATRMVLICGGALAAAVTLAAILARSGNKAYPQPGGSNGSVILTITGTNNTVIGPIGPMTVNIGDATERREKTAAAPAAYWGEPNAGLTYRYVGSRTNNGQSVPEPAAGRSAPTANPPQAPPRQSAAARAQQPWLPWQHLPPPSCVLPPRNWGAGAAGVSASPGCVTIWSGPGGYWYCPTAPAGPGCRPP